MNMELWDDDDDLDALGIILYGIPRRIYVRGNYFHDLDELNFFQRFRLTKNTVLNLLERIENVLEYETDRNNSVSPINQLLICLRIYATGAHLLTMADFGGVHKSTVSRIVVRVTTALAEIAGDFIKFPTTNVELTRSQREFFDVAEFPRVIGAIDCSHIRIQSPGGADAEVFRNRKKYFSINVQAVTNANFEFTNIVARWPGSAHDSTIFHNSRLHAEFEDGHYPNSLLLGDSGYAIKPYLLTPLLDPRTDAERTYNQRHIKTRVRVENIFGIWKRRFPILAYGCRLKLQTVLSIIVSTAVLHNIARQMGEPEPPADPAIDQHRLQELIDVGEVPVLPPVQPGGNNGYNVRTDLIENYFRRL